MGSSPITGTVAHLPLGVIVENAQTEEVSKRAAELIEHTNKKLNYIEEVLGNLDSQLEKATNDFYSSLNPVEVEYIVMHALEPWLKNTDVTRDSMGTLFTFPTSETERVHLKMSFSPRIFCKVCTKEITSDSYAERQEQVHKYPNICAQVKPDNVDN